MNAFPTDAQEDSIVSGAWLYEVTSVRFFSFQSFSIDLIADDTRQGLASHHWADNLEPEERERFRRQGHLLKTSSSPT